MKTDNNLRSYGPYQAALKDDWEGLKSFFEPQDLDKKQGPAAALSTPLTAAGDIAFHLVVFSQREEPLKSFLSIGESNPMTIFDFLTKNDYGNTALHEAAANGNIEAVKLLVNHINELSVGDYEHLSSEALEDKNNEGETPLLRAAAYGKTKVVNFLAPKSLADGKLKDSIHRKKTLIRKEPKPDASYMPVGNREIKEVVHDDNSAIANQGEIITVLDASILHVAIQGQHFETALELLELDESLPTMKDMNGCISLLLLATIPSAFKNGYRMGAWINRVFYFCMYFPPFYSS